MYTAHVVFAWPDDRQDTLHRSAERALDVVTNACVQRMPVFVSVVPYPPRGDRPAILCWRDEYADRAYRLGYQK